MLVVQVRLASNEPLPRLRIGTVGDSTAIASRVPRVFIGYSHDSAAHQERVRALCEKLRGDGIDALIDQYVATARPPQGWPRWMDEQLRLADFVVLVCTPTYWARVEGRDEPGRGHGVLWEGSLVYQLLYNAGTRNERFVPVLLGDSGPNDIPLPLQGGAFFRADDATGYEDLYRRLTGQPRVVAAALGHRRTLPPLPAADLTAGQAAPDAGCPRPSSRRQQGSGRPSRPDEVHDARSSQLLRLALVCWWRSSVSGGSARDRWRLPPGPARSSPAWSSTDCSDRSPARR